MVEGGERWGGGGTLIKVCIYLRVPMPIFFVILPHKLIKSFLRGGVGGILLLLPKLPMDPNLPHFNDGYIYLLELQLRFRQFHTIRLRRKASLRWFSFEKCNKTAVFSRILCNAKSILSFNFFFIFYDSLRSAGYRINS